MWCADGNLGGMARLKLLCMRCPKVSLHIKFLCTKPDELCVYMCMGLSHGG